MVYKKSASKIYHFYLLMIHTKNDINKNIYFSGLIGFPEMLFEILSTFQKTNIFSKIHKLRSILKGQYKSG